MATSGTVYSGYSMESRLYVKWTRTGTWNDSTCGSNLKWELYLDNHNWWYNNAIKCYTIYINGTAVYNGGTWSNKTTYGQILLASGKATVPHNNDGEKSFEISFSGWFYSSSNVSGKDTFTLDTIPRASKFGDVEGNVIGSSITIDITRYNSSFTHTLKYTIGTKTVTVLDKSTAITATFTPALTLCSEIPDAEVGVIKYELITYNDSTQIGSTEISSYKVYVPGSVVPSISSINTDETVDGLASQFDCYVRYKSKIKVTLTASGTYDSTIKSYSTIVDGKTYTGSTFETGVFNSAGSFTISTTVTDSRGRTATKTETITIVDYYEPKAIGFTVNRCLSDGTLDDEGTHAKLTYNYDIAPVNDRNNKIIYLQYLDGTTWTTLTTLSAYSANDTYVSEVAFSGNSSWSFRLYVEDYFSNAKNEKLMRTVFTLINYHDSGRALAFGKVSEIDNAVEFGLDIYDKYKTLIPNGLATYGSGQIDPNTTLETLLLTDNSNVPTGGSFWYVITFFFQSKSTTANRSQLAIPYSINAPIYHRYYYNGTWSEWRE